MTWIKIKRVITSGFFNFWRNGFISLSSILVMMVTLFVIGATIFSGAILSSTLQEIRDKVDINVYLVRSANENDILELKKNIEQLPEVLLPVVYVSRDLALANFKKRHENDQFTLQALDELGENPLGATLNIKAKDPSQYETIAEFLQNQSTLSPNGESIIDKVNYYQNKAAIDRLSHIINSANRLSFILTVFLIIFYPITIWLGGATQSFFVGFNIFSYYTSHFGEIFLIIVGSGVIIGSISSYLAVHKYLKI